MVDKIKRETRARMARTGESYTEARRAVAHGTDVTTADRTVTWTWRGAVDRLDALTAMLRHADEMLEHVDTVRKLRPPRTEGWTPMLRALQGDEWGTRHGLVGAVNDLVAAADPQPVRRAREWHLRWYAEQAWELLAAAADDQAPVEVAAALPAHEYDWEPAGWYPPGDAREVARRAGSAELTAPVVSALAGINTALAATDSLNDWHEALTDRHREFCEDDDCYHSPGPAEHELDAWGALEDEAAGYEPALIAFCDAVRALVRAHASTHSVVKSIGNDG